MKNKSEHLENDSSKETTLNKRKLVLYICAVLGAILAGVMSNIELFENIEVELKFICLIISMFLFVIFISYLSKRTSKLKTTSNLDVYISSILSLYLFLILALVLSLITIFITLLLVVIDKWMIICLSIILFIFLFCIIFWNKTSKSKYIEYLVTITIALLTIIIFILYKQEFSRNLFNLCMFSSTLFTLSVGGWLIKYLRKNEPFDNFIKVKGKVFIEAATVISIGLTIAVFTDTVYVTSGVVEQVNYEEVKVEDSNESTNNNSNWIILLITDIEKAKLALETTVKIIKNEQFSFMLTVIGVGAYLLYWNIGSVGRKERN